MTDINHVILVGRLTRDCGGDERSFGYLQNGTAVARVSIAVNRSKKGADGNWTDEGNFFDVTIWGKLAESLKPKLTKGTQIAVDGYLKQDRWEKDGQSFSKVSVVANSVQVFTPKQTSNGDYDGYQSPKTQQTYSQPVQTYQEESDGFPEEIPF